ncbi:MAG: biotin/lipoate A/B protein ligase family protein [Halobacteria archaeon]
MTEWRLMPFGTRDAYLNMALDEAVSESVSRGDSAPTFRLYRWSPSAVSIGYFQSLENEVDVGNCEEDGVDYVRRRTGGGAVYHDYDGEITYSVAAPLDLYSDDLTESYREICGRVVDALDELGIDGEFEPINDIVVGGKKISGNAQTRRKGVLLQHGTLLQKVDPEEMFRYLKPDVEKVTDKHVAGVEERVTSIQRESDAEMEDTVDALKNAFLEGREYVEEGPRELELERAQELAEERYFSADWNRMK